MKLRGKTVLIISSTLIVLFVVLFFTSQSILLGSYIKFERENTKDNVKRAVDALNDDITGLDTTARDYASWDQTYDFMKTNELEFIKTEFADETMENIKVNLLAILKPNGDVMFEKSYDMDCCEESEVSPELRNSIIQNKELIAKINESSSIAGLIRVDNQPMLIALRPILTTQEKGPMRGILIMGRHLDAAEVKRLNGITHLTFGFHDIKDKSIKTEIQTVEQYYSNEDLNAIDGVYVRPLSNTEVAGYTVLKDVYGKDSLYVKVSLSRDIFLQGRKDFIYFIQFFIIIGVVFTLVITIFVDRFMLSRLLRLSKEVNRIGSSGEFGARIKIKGRDELSILSQDINGMLEKLDSSMNELRTSNEKLKELDTMKTDFLSTVSHELRTPLTSILGFAKIITKKFNTNIMPNLNLEDKKAEKAANQVVENLNIIVSEGQRLTSLINDVLDIAKMEAGKIDWRMQLIAISDVVDRAFSATTSLINNKELEVIKEVENDLPGINADMDRLIQVVINLISNAVKFTDKGIIKCKVKRVNNDIQVSITDSGIGIAKGDVNKIFEKFKQVGDTLTNKPQGTGLGLPICRQIIEHHGGKIWVESQLGQGSTFIFSIPADNNEAIEERKEAQEEIIDKNQVENDKNNEKKTVLIVDDDTNIRNYLKQELESSGYQVVQAVDGVDAVGKVKINAPDLIILDIMMPKMNGFDVAAVIKNDPKTMNIPIIIVSIIDDKYRLCRLKIDKQFTKPINAEELLIEVDTLMKAAENNYQHLKNI